MDPALRGVDEDEGSPLRNGATHDVDLDTALAYGASVRALPYSISAMEKSKDQRKPSGSAMTRPSFPSR